MSAHINPCFIFVVCNPCTFIFNWFFFVFVFVQCFFWGGGLCVCFCFDFFVFFCNKIIFMISLKHKQ